MGNEEDATMGVRKEEDEDEGEGVQRWQKERCVGSFMFFKWRVVLEF